MNNRRENSMHQGWQVPAMVINKVRSDAERWQAAIREFTPPLNLADILRGRPHAQQTAEAWPYAAPPAA